MSTYQQVGKAIQEAGRATVDDLAPMFSDMTRKQLRGAIQNARNFGLIVVLEAGRSLGSDGFAGAIYGPVPPPARPVSFVFDLGARA